MLPPVVGAAATGNENALLAELFPASVTWTVNEKVPVWVVVPDS